MKVGLSTPLIAGTDTATLATLSGIGQTWCTLVHAPQMNTVL